MMNLYCYNSPLSSSVGFRVSGWAISDSACDKIEVIDKSNEAVQSLTDSGVKTICFDSKQGTRVFLMRGLTVQGNNHMGWHINFALETDEKSYSLWADLTAAFLSSFGQMKLRLASLFSVNFGNGEHYDLDGKKFLEMARQAEGCSKTLYGNTGKGMNGASQKAFHQFAALLRMPMKHRLGQILLLVPASTIDYFLCQTSLAHFSLPRLCIGNSQWESLLAHETPKESGSIEQELQKLREKERNADLVPFMLATGAFVGTLCVTSAVISKKRKSSKQKK